MGGHVLESWKEEMIRIGRAEGHAELLLEQVQKKIEKGKSVAQIAEELEEEIGVIRPIYDKLVSERE